MNISKQAYEGCCHSWEFSHRYVGRNGIERWTASMDTIRNFAADGSSIYTEQVCRRCGAERVVGEKLKEEFLELHWL